ncbi:MAG: cytochrome c biogenesis protein CcsA [Alistipes sp.]
MTWSEFIWFAIAAGLLWIAGAVVALASRSFSRPAVWLTGAGLCVYSAFIVALWIALQRPPLRTMGETRLWYSFFVILSGLLTYRRWHYRWLLFFATVISLVFVMVNLLKPEIHDQSLMPALQSFWFVPHVTVYIFSYSVLGCAFILALAGWVRRTDCYFPTIDRLVYIGMAFLTLGMMSGALWAKSAWGNFWNWDPKETWAAITWCIYLLYIHLRLYGRGSRTLLNVLLTLGFLCMQMCWYGVNYLPAAKESLHVY